MEDVFKTGVSRLSLRSPSKDSEAGKDPESSTTACSSPCHPSPGRSPFAWAETPFSGDRRSLSEPQLVSKERRDLFESNGHWFSLRRKKSGLDRYVVEEDTLGKGGFANVYPAKWRNLRGKLPTQLAQLREDELDSAQIGWLDALNRRNGEADAPFACKLTKPTPGLGEVETLRTCQGPRVLLLVEHFVAEDPERQGRPARFIITNRCYGTAAQLENLPFQSAREAELAVKWSAQLVSAVARVHAHGVVHRDVKPTNLFCTAPGLCGDVMLGDFGLAVVAERCKTAGSWGFWDPEAFDGAMTKASDVWAVGITALRLCGINLGVDGGVTLNKNVFKRQIRRGKAQKQVARGSGVPPELEEGLQACFDLDSRARLSSADLADLIPDSELKRKYTFA